MQTQNMYELAEQLKQLREKKKAAEQQLKDIHAEIAQTEYQLSMQWQKQKPRISLVPERCLL